MWGGVLRVWGCGAGSGWRYLQTRIQTRCMVGSRRVRLWVVWVVGSGCVGAQVLYMVGNGHAQMRCGSQMRW